MVSLLAGTSVRTYSVTVIPCYSYSFGKSHVTKKCHCQQISARSDTFPLSWGCHCNLGCLWEMWERKQWQDCVNSVPCGGIHASYPQTFMSFPLDRMFIAPFILWCLVRHQINVTWVWLICGCFGILIILKLLWKGQITFMTSWVKFAGKFSTL